jgi:hypothetical protein
MTKKEYVNRNIGLTFDFIHQVVDRPEILDTIPNGAELDFIDKDLPIKAKVESKKRKIIRYKVEHLKCNSH